jgi:Mg-chelatase subunit ChlD
VPASEGRVVVPLDGPEGEGHGDAGAAPRPPRPQGFVATSEAGERRDLDELGEAAEGRPEVHRMAEVIARRLSLRPTWLDREPARGTGRLASVPYRYGSDDIDLDRTLEVLTERPVPEDTDIIVRERRRGSRAVALVVDVSGSMRGEKANIAAATVAALTRDLVDDELAVVAFWKHAVVVKPLARARPAPRVVDDLLRLPARGLTNVHFALGVALDELAGARARRRAAVLLSDAVHNAGPDPRLLAPRFPALHVLLEVDGEHDAELAADLARLGRGQLHPVRHHRDVAPALNRVLGG